MAEHLRVYLLGEFRCYRDGVLVSSRDWHTRQARQLFKLLLTERGHTVSVRKLMHLLWPEYGDSAYKTLRSAVSTLRTVLEPGRDPQAPARFVPRGRAGCRRRRCSFTRGITWREMKRRAGHDWNASDCANGILPG